MITQLSHLTFLVKDLSQSKIFFELIFDAKEIYSSEEKQFSISKEKFFLIGTVWVCIMEGNSLSEKTYNHTAFYVSEEEFEEYVKRIKNLNLDVRPERSRVEGEGRSIYFYDYDNHLFELHTGTLAERLKRYQD